jgi:hypothetical protein
MSFRNLSETIKKFTESERFQCPASESIPPIIEINSGVEADKAARDFTATIASAYRQSTNKVTLSDINNDIPGLNRLLKHKHRLRKLWQETRDPACKTVFNWVTKAIRRITRKKELEHWETKISNIEVTPQAMWLSAKSLLKTDGPTAPTAIHGPSGLKFHQSEKANALLIVGKSNSHQMFCVTKIMNGGWRLEFMLCSTP